MNSILSKCRFFPKSRESTFTPLRLLLGVMKRLSETEREGERERKKLGERKRERKTEQGIEESDSEKDRDMAGRRRE